MDVNRKGNSSGSQQASALPRRKAQEGAEEEDPRKPLYFSARLWIF